MILLSFFVLLKRPRALQSVGRIGFEAVVLVLGARERIDERLPDVGT